MRRHVVARNTINYRTRLDKIFVFVAELQRLGCAAGGVVFGVEEKHKHLVQMRGVADLDTASGFCFKLWDQFVYN